MYNRNVEKRGETVYDFSWNEELILKKMETNTSLDMQDRFGQTALINISIMGGVNLAKQIIDTGANVNAKDKLGRSALFFASKQGHFEIVKLLISAGADVNDQNVQGLSPLMQTSYRQKMDIVIHLIKSGADVNAKDKNGWTSLTWTMHESDGINEDIVKVLLKFGSDINVLFRELTFFISMHPSLKQHIESNLDLLDEKNVEIWKAYRLKALFDCE